MDWDNVIIPPCAIETADDPQNCPPVTGPGITEPPVCDDLDVCCADPAFAAAHPDLCAGRITLVLKPSASIVTVLQGVQFKTFAVANGVEVEVTNGLTYMVSDQNIAVIGGASGNATGTMEGIVTVSVQWQNLYAFAQLTVVDSCENSQVGMMLVVDNSRSMSINFSAFYANKLAYAKSLARQFALEINYTKDKIGLISFNNGATVRSVLTDAFVGVADLVSGIPSSLARTNLDSALAEAISQLDGDADINRKVIVLFSDGERNEGADPLPRATAFKEAGGIIVVVAVRANGSAYSLLQKVASGGFFLSAHNLTAEDTKEFLSGLKGYFCAGNCNPAAGTVNRGALNYTGFIEWDVTSGVVDLIGGGPWPLFDLVPGNGLYVDLCGSGSTNLKGTLTSIRDFTFITGRTYLLQVSLAGNQRFDAEGFITRIQIGSLLDTTVTIDDWQEDFTNHTFQVTGDGSTGKIIISQSVVPAEAPQFYGNLLDVVRFDEIAPGTENLLYDVFDNENPVEIPDECSGAELAAGCYGTGCMTDPIPDQIPDPSPAPDIEN